MGTPGAYGIWPADENGEPIDFAADSSPPALPNPRRPDAVDIFAGPKTEGEPAPQDQAELQADIDKLLGILRRLYLEATPAQPQKFRAYYVRTFQIAQLGLEGHNVQTGLARSALTALSAELVEDEAGKVKNQHLARLGSLALKYGGLCLWAYTVLHLLPAPLTKVLKEQLALDPSVAGSFMLLWLGCFLGTWLSYGVRTATFTLADLTRPDSDRLLPHMRLLFTGSLTMLLGMMLALNLIDLKIGNIAASRFTEWPLLAVLVGALCGIGESKLPAAIAGKAGAFVGGIK